MAVYATHTWKINDPWVLNDGLRLAQVNLKSTFTDKTFYNFPFSEAKQSVLGWSGNLGLIYSPKEDIKVSAMGSTGFRVPNVDDMTKVFDSSRGKVFVPNDGIKPEKTYNLDLSVAKSFNNVFSLEGSFFYTAFRDAIVADKFTFNGQDSIVYDGVKSAVYANQNKNKANIVGVSVTAKADITEGVSAYATYNYTKGRIQNSDGTDSPLDHVAPAFGRIGVRYNNQKLKSELFSNFSAAKKLADYSASGEDNLVYATAQGMPSWWTLNVRASYMVAQGLVLQLGVENMMDVNYRVFASGVHSAGRNIYGTVRYNF
jgi:hemoglobin/transferrin/lactoferrin receptor protein